MFRFVPTIKTYNMTAIKISSKSLYARLYKFVYRRSLPKGLCLLFWANLFALVGFIPYVLWILPMLVVQFIVEKDKTFIGSEQWRDNNEETGQLFGICFLLWILVAIIITVIVGNLSLFGVIERVQGAELGALVVWVLTFVSLTVWLVNTRIRPYCVNKKYNRKLSKHREALELNGHKLENLTDSEISRLYRLVNTDPNFVKPTHWIVVVITAVKGFVERSCPTINWV